MTEGWNAVATRALGDAETLMWNHIIHSWVDPVALFLVVASVFFGAAWIMIWLFRTTK